MPCRVFSVLLLSALVAAPRAVSALTDEEVFRDFRFNLINPGARSLALGGAFVSLADDATAAQANPAGLSFLLRQEYFVEVRAVDNAARSSIRTETLPAGIQTFVATGTDLDDSVSSSFLSAVIPFERWTLGFSRQELLNLKNDTLSAFSFTFPDSPGAFLAQGAGFIDVEIVNYNLSVGGRITEKLAIGGTLTLSQVDARSQVENLVVDVGGNLTGTEILEPVLDLRTSIDDDDEDVTGSLGLIYRWKEGQWSVGAVYRKAPSFELAESIEPTLDAFGVAARLGAGFGNHLVLPDSYGVGASWRPSDRLTLALDLEQVEYADLLDGYVSGVNILTSSDAKFTVDDGTNVRFGAEYIVFTKLSPLAFRGGAFTEADSTIRAETTGSQGFATPEVFKGGEDQVHGAVGLGLSWKRVKLDVAADFSETDSEYVLSFILQGKGK